MPIFSSNRVTLCKLNVQFYIQSSNTRDQHNGERWAFTLWNGNLNILKDASLKQFREKKNKISYVSQFE